MPQHDQRPGTRAVARAARRGAPARRTRHAGELRPRGRCRARAGPAAARQRLQGPAGAQPDGPHAVRSVRGAVIACTLDRPAVGAAMARVEGFEKVTGAARYAVEHDVEGVVHASVVQSTVAKGVVRAVDAGAALALPGVLDVLWYENAPRVADDDDLELAVLQRPDIAYRGQIVAVAVADSLEVSREAAALVRVGITAAAHKDEATTHHPKLYKPDKVNPAFETDTERGDVEAGLAAAATTIDA